MKIARYSIILTAVGLTAYFVYLLYQTFWGADPLRLTGNSLSQLFENGNLVALIIIPVTMVIAAFAMRPFLRILFPAEIKNAVMAQAKVLKVWDTGVSVNDNPQVGLLLEISPLGSMPFQAETKTLVSRLNAALVQPGIAAEVKYDPQKPQRLQLVSLQIGETPASGAAARMEELNALRDKGLITEEEYTRKREEILKAL